MTTIANWIESHKYRLYFIVTSLILAVAAYAPARECLRLFRHVAHGSIVGKFADTFLIIPFVAIIFAMLIAIILFPLLLKSTGGAFKKTKIALLVLSVVLFVASSQFVERMAAKQWEIINIVSPISVNLPKEYQSYAADILTSRAPNFYVTTPRQQSPGLISLDYSQNGVILNSKVHITTPVVKIHYYIFSIVLILIMLNFIYNLSTVFAKSGEKIKIPALITQGLATASYVYAVLFVKVIEYIQSDMKLITTESAVSAVLCIMLAAISVGLVTDNLLSTNNKIPKTRLIPPLISAATVIILYIGEYFLLDGGFYRYGEGFLFKGLPLIGISASNIVVILFPAVIVYIISKKLRNIITN